MSEHVRRESFSFEWRCQPEGNAAVASTVDLPSTGDQAGSPDCDTSYPGLASDVADDVTLESRPPQSIGRDPYRGAVAYSNLTDGDEPGSDAI